MNRGFFKKLIGGWEYQESMQKKENKVLARRIVRAKDKVNLKKQIAEVND